jgi:hypothetical protein
VSERSKETRMFDWFKKRAAPPPTRPLAPAPPPAPLASVDERDAVLRDLHPLFRVVDTGFHIYMAVAAANPEWDDDRVERVLRVRGVDSVLAQELVSFAPLAFGREIVQELGVQCSDLYRLHNLTDGSETELPLAGEMAYAWARAMVGLYRTAERNEVFKRVAVRSAELNAVNNALHGGVTKEGLQESRLSPSLVYLRRTS